MSDIVQRLRDRVHDSHMDNERLMDEAADEIERLRGLIDAHNADCIARCEAMRQQPNPGQGGICAHYTNLGRTCRNCPRDEMIEE